MGPFSYRWWRRMAIACALVPTMAQAEFTVIYDNGNTQPIAPFLEAFESADDSPQQSPIPTKPQLGAADPKALLPIRSPGLTPGRVETRSHERPFTRPFFLIGSDARSRKWLQTHRNRLKEIGAVGMLVQADTVEDLRTTATLAEGLSILPASGSDIAQALGITHYPVLITPHGIEQ
ncbi:MAG: integrating conjugative element protein [Candidatus Thiodiazotropha endolucinida]|nr:integrating conjugative element protein [Candidatus Thiodiazotropha taylori]MCG8096736.1 integrating conjugative element protein [Candidatus Thiodiazotropha endolucinida]MCW4268570.1 integrating conjugative element protein [Candidatus Thiodiazotropha endolucinida]